MSDQQNMDKDRRNLLIAAPVAGDVGGAAVAVPFVCTLASPEKARAAGTPVEADVSDLAPGRMKVVKWYGKPIQLLKRMFDVLESLEKTDNKVIDPKSDVPFTMKTPDYCKNEIRSRAEHRDLLVVVDICFHLDCSPSGLFLAGTSAQLVGDPGFVRPCHGSALDLVGCVFKSRPAPQNPDVLPYMFLFDMRLVISKGEKGEV